MKIYIIFIVCVALLGPNLHVKGLRFKRQSGCNIILNLNNFLFLIYTNYFYDSL